ncbi:hypothetical protein [Schaalia sp. lx-100]|uniref:hypothetical protein n=1 Tax=Schaalia sp. lx-100 TaxID=2899081 RepID=UPI001E49A027|nr:hypothetical protein [Schaalia sp. lx-100]MCD4557745.1 hypothetical protein [Schaalia sp. lx-100]
MSIPWFLFLFVVETLTRTLRLRVGGVLPIDYEWFGRSHMLRLRVGSVLVTGVFVAGFLDKKRVLLTLNKQEGHARSTRFLLLRTLRH